MKEKIDVQNLDYALALLIKPLLEQYRNETTAHPCILYHYPDPMREWHNRLDKMIGAFDHIISLKGERPDNYDRIYTIFVGLKYFSEHYLDLWFVK